jgi:hypothetical protein
LYSPSSRNPCSNFSPKVRAMKRCFGYVWTKVAIACPLISTKTLSTAPYLIKRKRKEKPISSLDICCKHSKTHMLRKGKICIVKESN